MLAGMMRCSLRRVLVVAACFLLVAVFLVVAVCFGRCGVFWSLRRVCFCLFVAVFWSLRCVLLVAACFGRCTVLVVAVYFVHVFCSSRCFLLDALVCSLRRVCCVLVVAVCVFFVVFFVFARCGVFCTALI